MSETWKEWGKQDVQKQGNREGAGNRMVVKPGCQAKKLSEQKGRNELVRRGTKPGEKGKQVTRR